MVRAKRGQSPHRHNIAARCKPMPITAIFRGKIGDQIFRIKPRFPFAVLCPIMQVSILPRLSNLQTSQFEYAEAIGPTSEFPHPIWKNQCNG
jgi:hypothetical protein